MLYLKVIFFSFLLSILLTFLIQKLAKKFDIIDNPKKSSRKIHAKPVPFGGGWAVFLTFFLISVYLVFFTNLILGKYITLPIMASIWLALFIILLGGTIDDKKNLNPKWQIIFPVLAIIIVIVSGVKIGYITNPLGGTINFSDFPIFGSFFTFLWLIGMSYTTKISDGIDGLVGGISIIGLLAIFLLSLFFAPAILPEVAILAITATGAFAGFLIFNWHPAKIFLGEGGSLIAGFLIGVLAIITDGKIAITLLIMSVPILDLSAVIIQRIKKKQSPFATSDKKHLHFRLLDAGFSQKQTVLIFYAFSFLLGFSALFLKSAGRFLMLLAIVILFYLFLYFYLQKKK